LVKQIKKWLLIGSFQERCGTIIAKEAPIKNANFVVGVPDSGISLATGYANQLNLAYRQVIVRDHFDRNGNQRLFLRDDQKKRIKKNPRRYAIGKKISGLKKISPETLIFHSGTRWDRKSKTMITNGGRALLNAISKTYNIL